MAVCDIAAGIIRLTGVTIVADILISCCAQNTVALWASFLQAACGAGMKKLCSPHQEITSLWVAVAFGAHGSAVLVSPGHTFGIGEHIHVASASSAFLACVVINDYLLIEIIKTLNQ